MKPWNKALENETPRIVRLYLQTNYQCLSKQSKQSRSPIKIIQAVNFYQYRLQYLLSSLQLVSPKKVAYVCWLIAGFSQVFTLNIFIVIEPQPELVYLSLSLNFGQFEPQSFLKKV